MGRTKCLYRGVPLILIYKLVLLIAVCVCLTTYSVLSGSVEVGVGVVTLPVETRRSGDPGSGPHTVSSGPSPLVIITFLNKGNKFCYGWSDHYYHGFSYTTDCSAMLVPTKHYEPLKY